jgi:hypothetical protein
VRAFLSRLAALPVREWLAARDKADGTGDLMFHALAACDDAVKVTGRLAYVRRMEDGVRRMTATIEWFAQTAPNHGITRRDLAGLELLAEWAGCALLVRDRVDPYTVNVLLAPWRGRAI